MAVIRRRKATNALLSFTTCSGESGNPTVVIRVANKMVKTATDLRILLDIILLLPRQE